MKRKSSVFGNLSEILGLTSSVLEYQIIKEATIAKLVIIKINLIKWLKLEYKNKLNFDKIEKKLDELFFNFNEKESGAKKKQ